MRPTTILHTLLFIIGYVFAAYVNTTNTNLAVYWGQNSMKTHGEGAQKPLEYYCDDSNVDIIIVAFVVALNNAQGNTEVNFANAQAGCNETMHPYTCPHIGANITYCQGKGKTVLLSIGGDQATTEVGYASTAEAEAGAQKIWAMFGPLGEASAKSTRPLGDAVVDGFDLDFEETDALLTSRNIPAFAKKLRELILSSSKKSYLTAAPQCVNVETDTIIQSVDLDMVFVQFYNNVCANGRTPGFNFDAWNAWSEKKKTPFFVGLPGNVAAAPDSGYIDPKDLYTDLTGAKKSSWMKGAMLWDASQAWANDKYHVKVKNALTG